MGIKNLLKKLDFSPPKEEIKEMNIQSKKMSLLLKSEIKKRKIKADVFFGGSFAKNTIVRKDVYDIDVFVRFYSNKGDISLALEKIVGDVCKKAGLEFKRMHGSRDYFQINCGKIIFEIVPVLKIKKPKEAQNVTDLSYFHVDYVKKKIKAKKNLAREIQLAKTFCRAAGVYGAESYIGGFSGYALECLIIYYKSFEKMLKAILNSKENEKIIIDGEKRYKNKNEIMVSLNGSKLNSPIILIDPTWKERNALAALGKDTLDKFKERIKKFMDSPSVEFFENREIKKEDIKKEAERLGGEFVIVESRTEKQEGDIAGTKLKKFSMHLKEELSKYYEVIRYEFHYDESHGAKSYFVLKNLEKGVLNGPMRNMEEHCKAFRKIHGNSVFEKEGRLYARAKKKSNAKEFLKEWIAKNQKKISDMKISGVLVC